MSRDAESLLPLVLAANTPDPVVRQDFQRRVGAFARRNPQLIAEMLPTNREKRALLRQANTTLPDGAFLDDLPLLVMPASRWRPHLSMFARKLTLALHYRYVGRPLSLNGRIVFRWYFNFDAQAGRLPGELNEILNAVDVDEQASLPNRDLHIGHARMDGAEIETFVVSIFDQLLLLAWSSEDPTAFSPEVREASVGPFSSGEIEAEAA